MGRNIDVGDRVFVRYLCYNNSFYGVVESTPSATGDMWYLKTEETNTEPSKIIALNNQAADLLWIEKAPKD